MFRREPTDDDLREIVECIPTERAHTRADSLLVELGARVVSKIRREKHPAPEDVHALLSILDRLGIETPRRPAAGN